RDKDKRCWVPQKFFDLLVRSEEIEFERPGSSPLPRRVAWGDHKGSPENAPTPGSDRRGFSVEVNSLNDPVGDAASNSAQQDGAHASGSDMKDSASAPSYRDREKLGFRQANGKVVEIEYHVEHMASRMASGSVLIWAMEPVKEWSDYKTPPRVHPDH